MIKVLSVGAGAVVLALVAVAAGWWFLVRDSAELATSPPQIPQELVQATSTPSTGNASDVTSTAGTVSFEINSTKSEAAYFVDEELASVGLPSTAKGATSDVTGTLHLTADGTALASGQPSQFTVNLETLTSDKSQRDERVQQALETGRYPTATFTITSVSGYNPSIAEGQEQSLKLTGVLELHGVNKEVIWDVKAVRQGNVISALATVTVNFSDFSITPPRFAGLVSIDDQATLQVQLIAQAA